MLVQINGKNRYIAEKKHFPRASICTHIYDAISIMVMSWQLNEPLEWLVFTCIG